MEVKTGPLFATDKQIDDWLTDVTLGLNTVIRLALNEDDSRFDHILEQISQAVWKTAHEIEAVEAKETTEDGYPIYYQELLDLTNAMHGRVLTVLEAAFGAPMQCEAVKSLARPKVWRFHKRAVEANK